MVTQATHLARSTGTSYTLTRATGTNYTLVQSSDTYANYLDALLAESVWWIDSHQATGSETIPNLGTGGTALDALNGGGTAITTNDAKWLEYADGDGAYLYLTGVASNYASVPDAAALDITGDIDVRMQVALDDWTPSSFNTLFHKGDAGYATGYGLDVQPSGVLRFTWGNGAQRFKDSTAAVSVTDGAVKWVRATLDVDNGAAGHDVKFYTSDDGSSWTQLGTTVTTAGVTSITADANPLYIGVGVPTLYLSTGKYYRVQVLSGIDGTTVLDVDTSVLTDGSATSFTATTGQTVTINRSTSGRKSTVVHGGAGGGSLWLLGSDDFIETPDDPLLDFGASDVATVIWVGSRWAADNAMAFISKTASLGGVNAGWGLHVEPGAVVAMTGNGSVGAYSVPVFSDTYRNGLGLTSFAVVFNMPTGAMDWHTNGALVTPVASSLTAGLNASSSSVLRVGAPAGGTYFADMEFTAALIWRRALTTAEITAVSNYFTTRTHAE